MKTKKRRVLEVPPKIKSFIDSVTNAPLENIEEPLRHFVWEFDKGDINHWVDLFNRFDSFFETHIKPRKDLQIEDNFLAADPPFPKDAVLQIFRVMRIISDNCTNKHFYSPFEHVSFLLASTDADVVEGSLQTLAAFLKKTTGKCFIRDASLHPKLFAFSQGWGGKEEGLGLIACSTDNGCDSVAYELGCTLHFEFYRADDSTEAITTTNQPTQGLQVIHLPRINAREESDLELLNQLVVEYKVPSTLRFSLLTRLRLARAFGSLASRQQYICIRLYAFVVLVQASHDAEDLAAFFNNEPEFVNELVSLLSYEDAVPEKIRILSILALVALCQDRSRQTAVLTSVTSGGNRGILPSLMQKSIDAINGGYSEWSVVFADSLLSLITALVSTSSGCSALREAGLIPTLLPLLKDTDPQHLHLVATAIHVLEAFMDYSNPAAALFRDLGGLDDTIARLKIEVSNIEKGTKKHGEDSQSSRKGKQIVCDTSSDIDNMQPLYSDALVTYHRKLLTKALLRAISLGTYAPGSSDRLYGSAESLLPHCLCIIFRKAKEFGGGVFSLAATVMSDLIHKDPTCYPVLDAAELPSAFLDAVTGGVLCSAEAVTCIPQCLDALCLNNKGLQDVKDRNALRCFVKIFTSRTYARAFTGDTAGSLSTGLDELMRHASSLRGPGVDVLIEIVNTILKIGHGIETPLTTETPDCSVSVPMETDAEVSSEGKEPLKMETSEQPNEISPAGSLANNDPFLSHCIKNAARLYETILQNADACRIFIEKKGIESVLQLFTLPLLSFPDSVPSFLSTAFKHVSSQHSGALAQALFTFLRQHLKATNELLDTVRGAQLLELESGRQMEIARYLYTLSGLLSYSKSTSMVSELSTADSDVFKDLGNIYKEIVWQISLASDSKVEEKKDDKQSGKTNASVSVNTRNDEDADVVPAVRYTNSVSTRNSSHSQWSTEEDILSLFRSSRSNEVGHRHGRHGLSRMRGGRTGRHIEPLSIDSESSSSGLDNLSAQDAKSPDVLITENFTNLGVVMRSFFGTLVKGFTSTHRRRVDAGSLSPASKSLAAGLSKIFHNALSFSGHSSSSHLEALLSVKCRYLGKVVDDMVALTFDSRRRTCNAVLVNNFYVHGTFKELLTTFEATSQLLWTLPYSAPKSDEGDKLSHSSWLLDTLQNYCRMLECFVNSALLLSQTTPSQAQLLVQPAAAGLSIGLFPVPRDPEMFVRKLQSQVLDVILPIWNHPMLPSCSSSFIISMVSLVTHIYTGVADVKRGPSGTASSATQRLMAPPDEATVATIVEMGFTRARAEEALRRAETNSVEMAMEWLFNHAEDPVQEDDELARALALSLGNSSETAKEDTVDKMKDVQTEEKGVEPPPVDDILASCTNLFQNSDSMAFTLTDLLVTLCNHNKGDDRPRVVSYLIKQLKLCSSDFSKDTGALCTISHILALLISEDANARAIAAENCVVTAAIDILASFSVKNDPGKQVVVPKCVTALLLLLDNMLQSIPRVSPDGTEGSPGPIADLSGEHASLSIPEGEKETKCAAHVKEKGSNVLDKVLGKSTGYLSLEECHKVLTVACELLKQHVPAVAMQAVLQLCARLTKTHVIALQFLEYGGLAALFSLPISCFFPGYDTVASAIVRHLLEDPQTLQTAMELEIRQTLSGIHSRHSGRLSPRTFLMSMAPVISRDPVIFMKAAAAVCHLESSGGRSNIVLLKDKEKDKSKGSATEVGPTSVEYVRIPENKQHDTPGKCSKVHKKIPPNLTQTIDQLIEIVMSYPSPNKLEESNLSASPMDIDEANTKKKGKSIVGDQEKTVTSNLSERSVGIAKVTFVLKLMSDILLMYVHAVGVILRRDLEISQHKGFSELDGSGHGGILCHVLHRLLPISSDKNADTNEEWSAKLSEKGSWFLVLLSGRSSEGRRRVINEIVRALSLFSSLESNSSRKIVLPNKKLLAFADLVNSILSKNSPSSSLPGPGCSPDIAKTMIDGGMIQSLTSILEVIDLDHPDAPKVVNLILKALESLTRAANASEQAYKSDETNKKKTAVTIQSEAQTNLNSGNDGLDNDHNRNIQNDGIDAEHPEQLEDASHSEGDQDANPDQSRDENMRLELQETTTSIRSMENGLQFMREEMEEDGVIHSTDGVEVTFHVEHRGDNDMGDEDDDDMAEDGEEDDEDDEDEEDEDIAEDGAALMSLADTDVEDHGDNELGDEYNDEMVDDEDDDFYENRVIEVRWREGLDGSDQLQVVGRPGAAGNLIDVAAEPFQGLNVDDIFSVQRPLVGERRRQTRTLIERSGLDGGGFQHPLLLRPSQSGDQVVSMWSSVGNTSRDLENLSSGSVDVTHFYMFDTPVLPSEHASASLFGDRLAGSASQPSIDFSLGSMDPLHLAGRRGTGDSRWTDDGQPQPGAEAVIIAQAVEEVFVSQLLRAVPTNNSQVQRSSENSELQEKPQSDVPQVNVGSQSVPGGDNVGREQMEDLICEHGTGSDLHPENPLVETGVCIRDSSHEQVNAEFVNREANEGGEVQRTSAPNGNAFHSTTNGGESAEVSNVGATSEQLNVIPDLPSRTQDQGHSSTLANLCEAEDNSATRSKTDSESSNHACPVTVSEMPVVGEGHTSSVCGSADIDMDGANTEGNLVGNALPVSDVGVDEPSTDQNIVLAQTVNQADQTSNNNEGSSTNTMIDPTFLEALPEDLRAEVLATQQTQSVQAEVYAPPSAEDIDPEFLAALPPDIQAEVLAQQRAQRVVQSQHTEGQPVDMDNASIIATFPADLREEVLLTSSEAVLSALPSPLLAEAQMLRDRAMSHYQARSLFGSGHRLTSRRNSLGLDRQTGMDRGVGVTVGRRAISGISDASKLKELEGAPLLDVNSLKALIRLLRLAQPLGKGLLQRLLLNLCSHSVTRAALLHILLDMIRPEADDHVRGSGPSIPQRLYGCQSNVVYGRAQLLDGLPPLVSRRVLEILTYLATNHSSVANSLFYFDPSLNPASISSTNLETSKEKGKEKILEGVPSIPEISEEDVPIILFLKLLNQPLFLRSSAHLEQVMGLLQVAVYTGVSKIECQPHPLIATENAQSLPPSEELGDVQENPSTAEPESSQTLDKHTGEDASVHDGKRPANLYDVILKLPQQDLRNLCSLLSREGLSDKVYLVAAGVLKKLASVVSPHRKFFTSELAALAHGLSSSAVGELVTLKSTHMLGLSSGSMAGAAILRVLQALGTLTPTVDENNSQQNDKEEEQIIMWNLNVALEPLWHELSDCINTTESTLGQSSSSNINVGDYIGGATSLFPPLPPGTQRLLPFIEAFFVLCEKLQANNFIVPQDHANVTAREVKEFGGSSVELSIAFGGSVKKRPDATITFARFAEKHRRLLNAFIRQSPGLLEKSLMMMLKAPRLIDFDNKRAYFRSRIRQQHEQHPSAPLRISVRRAYVLEDSYNQLRMRPTQDLKGRLSVQFQGEEGIDAGGLTREWYQLLSRVIFDKGALLFTTVGNNATFQPNPNSVYQTEHLSYFKFVGRVVAKALFDGQLLDVYFTRSFYKHILGAKVTYHDIEAIDPDYYKNLKWMLENDVSDIPDLTFSMDADEEKHILYEKTEVTDYELIPGGRNTRVTEETKHEYVDLVAEHILTNAIRPQINSFLEGFNELVPRELISIFNDKELELLISGLPEIDLDDLKANTEYTGYTPAANVVLWFWEVVQAFNKEDMARFLQFVTGTSKVPLEGFKALQGISGAQRFQIHKAYGAPERLPSAHTCFNQLDLPEYSSKEQLQERLLLAIHEASEGFGFG